MNTLPAHFMVSECDGGLYDTRKPGWPREALRSIYCQTFNFIGNTKQLRATLRACAFTWPGGYPLYFVTSCGDALSFEAVRQEYRQVSWSIRNRCNDDWRVVGCYVNWEGKDLFCSHTNERIPRAYGDDQ